MSRRRIAYLGLLVAAVLACVWLVSRRDQVPTMEVRAGQFTRRIKADGYLKAVKSTPVSVPIEANESVAIAWLIEDGAPVRAGELVARFDPTTIEKNLRKGLSEKSITESRIGGKQAIEEATVANLKRDAELADMQLKNAREFQSTDTLLFSRNQIIESEVDEKLATKRKETADAIGEMRAQLAKADLSLLEIEKRQAELRITRAQHGLKSLEVRAPHDGVIVLTRNWRGFTPRIGDVLWPGQPIAEIPSLDEMEAEVFILEADAGGLAAGQKAIVSLEAHPEKTYKALTSKLDPLAKPRWRGVPVQYFGATLKLEKTDPSVMKTGQRVVASLTIENRSDVISIPRSAVFDDKGRKIVYRRSGSAFEPVEVGLGSAGLGRVIVEKGLADGDQIALVDPTRKDETPDDAATAASGSPGSPTLLRR